MTTHSHFIRAAALAESIAHSEAKRLLAEIITSSASPATEHHCCRAQTCRRRRRRSRDNRRAVGRRPSRAKAAGQARRKTLRPGRGSRVETRSSSGSTLCKKEGRKEGFRFCTFSSMQKGVILHAGRTQTSLSVP